MLKLKLQYLATWCEELTHWKDLDTGKDWRWEEKGTTEDEMVGWHHRLNGHEFEWTPGVGDGQGSLVCCSPWGRKQWGTTERLNQTKLNSKVRPISTLPFIYKTPSFLSLLWYAPLSTAAAKLKQSPQLFLLNHLGPSTVSFQMFNTGDMVHGFHT